MLCTLSSKSTAQGLDNLRGLAGKFLVGKKNKYYYLLLFIFVFCVALNHTNRNLFKIYFLIILYTHKPLY